MSVLLLIVIFPAAVVAFNSAYAKIHDTHFESFFLNLRNLSFDFQQCLRL